MSVDKLGEEEGREDRKKTKVCKTTDHIKGMLKAEQVKKIFVQKIYSSF